MTPERRAQIEENRNIIKESRKADKEREKEKRGREAFQKRYSKGIEKGYQLTGKCPECGGNMPGDRRRLYCSSACTRAVNKRVNRARDYAANALGRLKGERAPDPFKVFERDGWRCHLCLKPTRKDKRGTNHDRAPELDHIIPLAKGGAHTYANTACSCRKCNRWKRDTVIGQPSLLLVA
jgi:5-methylcytosine-specific restriction endonuclease McrA